MRTRLFLLSCLTFVNTWAQLPKLFIGTYDSPASEGIYSYSFDPVDGKIIAWPVTRTSNPSFLTVSQNRKFIYSVNENKEGTVSSFVFENGVLKAVDTAGSGGSYPCHIETDHTGNWLFVSNYGSGTLSLIKTEANGELTLKQTIQHKGSGADTSRQKSPHVHGAYISESNRTLYVTDLGSDRIFIYGFDAVQGQLSLKDSVVTDPGAGPRSLCFHPNGKYAYLVEEISGTVVAFRINDERLERMQRISTVKGGTTGRPGSADIKVSPDGKFLYAPNRYEMNDLAIYRIDKRSGMLKLVGHQPVLGKTPRNFSIYPSGRFLFCANQNSDEVVIFKRNKRKGTLADTGRRIKVGKPVCILQL